jgi:hypothetical protein
VVALTADIAEECFEIIAVGEGCTPGYWRNNLAKNIDGNDQSLTNWAVNHEDSFFDTFMDHTITVQTNYDESKHKGQGKSSDVLGPNLAEALWAQGGDINALARHAVAALLNSESPDVAYSLSSTAIIDLVWNAIMSGDATQIENAKNTLDTFNNDGCPIDQQPRIP